MSQEVGAGGRLDIFLDSDWRIYGMCPHMNDVARYKTWL